MIEQLAVVTGGAGFIGSNLVEEMGRRGQLAVVIDDFAVPEKWNNVRHPNIHELVNWTEAFDWMDRHSDRVNEVYSADGACTMEQRSFQPHAPRGKRP